MDELLVFTIRVRTGLLSALRRETAEAAQA